MRLLLDSHILLRWDAAPGDLSLIQRTTIADRRNEVFVSAVTAWELGIKRAKGRLDFTGSVTQMLNRFGFHELPVTMEHGEEVARLEWEHRDPFDRMLVAQAKVERMSLSQLIGRCGSILTIVYRFGASLSIKCNWLVAIRSK